MTGDFAGWTSENYASYRRDLPDAVVQQLVDHFALTDRSTVVDLGSGTGQAAIPMSQQVGQCIAVEPEPDLLQRLRHRRGGGGDVLGVLGSAADVPLVTRLVGGRVDLLTVVNALHFMDPAGVFGDALALLRPGGGIAVVSHGMPLWLADSAWARAVNRFLQEWLGSPTGGCCGLDDDTRAERAELLDLLGFVDVEVLRHEYHAELTPRYVVGHLYSALSAAQVPVDRRSDFEAGVVDAIESALDSGPLIEHVPVVALVARTPT